MPGEALSRPADDAPVALAAQEAPAPKVPVGLGSLTGLGGALAAFVLAVFAYRDGDRSEETITALVVGAVLLASVIWGRMLQAVAQIVAAWRGGVAIEGKLASVAEPVTEPLPPPSRPRAVRDTPQA